MPDITRKNLYDVVRQTIPEVEPSFGGAEGSYLLLAELAHHIGDNLNSGKLTEELLSRVFGLLNEMATHRDPEVQNILVAGFMEAAVGLEGVAPLLREHLCPEAVSLLDRTITGAWGD